jgi:hypothetical protein
MSISKVFGTLAKISETAGSKKKETLLVTMQKAPIALDFFTHACDKRANLWVTAPTESSVPLWKGRSDVNDMDKRWLQFKSIFKKLTKREVTGKAAQTLLLNFISSCSNAAPHFEGRWYIAAVNRHLNIGIGDAKIRKVWPMLVSDFSVQLALSLYEQKTGKAVEKVKKTIKFPVVIEPKLDGMNVSIVDDLENDEMAWSRRNSPLPSLERWTKAFHKAMALLRKKGFKEAGFVINGEFKSDMRPETDPKNWKSSWGKTMALCHAGVTPSGYDPNDIEPYVKECLDKDLYFVVYNCYPSSTYTTEGQTWPVRYGTIEDKGSRSWIFNQIVKAMKYVDPTLRIEVIHQDVAKDWEQASKFHAKNVAEGHEGSMVKQCSEGCVLDRSTAFTKWKVYKTVDAVILGVTRGTGKYENSAGALIVYLPDIDDVAKCTARTEEIRDWAWKHKDMISGFKIEVVADGSDDDVAKIRNPVLARFRHDVSPISPREVVGLCHRFNLPKPTSRISSAEYKRATASFVAE